jgi:hypothetical protein
MGYAALSIQSGLSFFEGYVKHYIEPNETKNSFFMPPIGQRAECYERLLIGGPYEFEEATTGACSRNSADES